MKGSTSSTASTSTTSMSTMPEGKWEWGGCGDNINFGFRKAKDFMDTRYKRRSDMKTLVKLHNYAAGRFVSVALKKKTIGVVFLLLKLKNIFKFISGNKKSYGNTM